MKTRTVALAAWIVLLACSTARAGADFDHGALDAIVKRAVKGRFVDYGAVEKDRGELKAYLAKIASANTGDLPSQEAKLAFYTNAYNALVLDAVLENGRPKDVSKVPGFFDKKTYKVAGEDLTLNKVEEKVRQLEGGKSKDPRVHFAVNCASYDCPPLMGRAFAAKSWSQDLDRLTKDYLSRPNEVAVDDGAKTIKVVQIFEWYQKDWGDEQAVRAFIAKFVPPDVAKKVTDPGYKLAYRPYDWRPNAAK